ncbi:HelD family protein [Lysinibacillus antri]|uniref:DNA 3'-5' helicase n=1 Tax=Lysinibacillus antri TaxID=2498145 RepID=A0A432L981_9BACI|nr:3'-5' exonuclease [Lysinibacillus antri]RUL49889.1 hypothetical protein EK386_14535 [Lysinibacillus antri]
MITLINDELKNEQLFLEDTIQKIDCELYTTSNETTMEELKKQPYFGKMEINSNRHGLETFYIGKKGLHTSEEEIVVLDWRMPIASTYYNFTPEQSLQVYEIDKNGETQKEVVDVLSKKQILIHNQKVTNIIEQFPSSDLERMPRQWQSRTNTKEMLHSNLDERETTGNLKEIIETIQQEQNIAIRHSLNKNIIIQGVAGSGKSSIALHRLSYLLFNNEHLRPANFLLIASSKRSMLPFEKLILQLDLAGIHQKTICQLMEQNLSPYVTIDTSPNYARYYDEMVFKEDDQSISEAIKFKASKRFAQLLEAHVERVTESYRDSMIPIAYGHVSITEEDLVKIFDQYAHLPFCTRVQKFLMHAENVFKNVLDQQMKELTDKTTEFKEFLMEVELEAGEIVFVESLITDIKEKKIDKMTDEFDQIMTNWKNAMNPGTILEIYNQLFVYFAKNDYDNEEIKALLYYYEPGKIDFHDYAPLWYLHVLLNQNHPVYKHVVIDEGQDLSYIHYATLKRMCSTMTIITDVNQAILMEDREQSWEEVIECFGEETTIVDLKNNYRSTKEIVKVANHVLNVRFNEEDAIKSVCSSGSPVTFETIDSGKTLMMKIEQTLKQWERKYKRIAIIHKDEKRAEALAKELQKRFDQASYAEGIQDLDISVIAVYNATGMEFDAVMLVNANDISYPNDDIHTKLLYVAITRAQKELKIFYQNNPSPLLEELVYSDTKDAVNFSHVT